MPGLEVSGKVKALGEGVTGFTVGQPVAALLTDFTSGGMGGYAQFACAKAALTVPLGPEDDLAIAAATLVNGATAFMATESLRRGTAVAINGASGGLGQSLLTATAELGASEIIAISGNPGAADTLRRAGATHVVAPGDFATDKQTFDAAFDVVGGKPRIDLLRRLKQGGRLVILGNASGDDTHLSGDDIWLRNLKVEGLTTGGLSHIDPDRIVTAARAALAAAARRPQPFAILTLEEAAEAHRALEARQGPGKFVLRIE